MNTKYSLKNFRVFGESGVDLNMTPITILTGCNSSGKSSVVKSMLLLRNFIEKLRKDEKVFSRFDPGQHYLDCSLPEVGLSGFNSAINRNSRNQEIVVAYTVQSPFSSEYNIEFHFKAHNDDPFNYGWLSDVQIKSIDGDILLKANVKDDVLVINRLNINNKTLLNELQLIAYAISLEALTSKIRNANENKQDDSNDICELKKRYAYLIKAIKRHGLESELLVPHLKDKLELCFGKQNIPSKDLIKPLYFYEKDSLMFYTPALELLRSKSKSEAIEIIANAKFLFGSDQDAHRRYARKLADDFKLSIYDNYIDYYRSLEKEKLDNVLSNQMSPTVGGLDFTSGFSSLSEIHLLNQIYNKSKLDFWDVYPFFAKWKLDVEYVGMSYGPQTITFYPNLYGVCLDYLNQLIKQLFTPNTFIRLKYVGNFHYNLQRLYVFDGKENEMGQIIKEYIRYRTLLLSQNKTVGCYKPGTFVDKWLKKLSIGKSLKIIEDKEGLGAKVFLCKDFNSKGYPLADEGYGVTQLVTVLLNIEVEILYSQVINVRKNVFGYDKVENIASPTIVFEEPEVSLHPSLQSQLADVFIDAYRSYGIHFIIETHSEYLIRRTQAVVANYRTKDEFENKPFSVIYIGSNGNAYNLEYLETGRFNRSFGPGFFDEATRSCVEILKREKRNRNGKDA